LTIAAISAPVKFSRDATATFASSGVGFSFRPFAADARHALVVVMYRASFVLSPLGNLT
jgi:hypothetical protein